MTKSATDKNGVDETTKAKRSKRTIVFRRRTSEFPESARERKNSLKHFEKAVAAGGGRPVNQRFRELADSSSFSQSDPVRPLRSHAKLAHDPKLVEKEIEALDRLIQVYLCSIARRTSEPQDLIRPLMYGLAVLVREFIDETSEHEMTVLDEGLAFLELTTHGKIRFARSGD
jgi:hypothetical protein